ARRPSLLSPLAKARGMARQVAQPLLSCARDPSRDRGAPLGAPPRQACAVRAYLRASSLRRRAALFVAAPNKGGLRQPSSWRAARIGHQAEPRRRPGACFAKHARGRRILLHHQTPLDDALDEPNDRTIFMIGLKSRVRTLSAVMPGHDEWQQQAGSYFSPV